MNAKQNTDIQNNPIKLQDFTQLLTISPGPPQKYIIKQVQIKENQWLHFKKKTRNKTDKEEKRFVFMKKKKEKNLGIKKQRKKKKKKKKKALYFMKPKVMSLTPMFSQNKTKLPMQITIIVVEQQIKFEIYQANLILRLNQKEKCYLIMLHSIMLKHQIAVRPV
ncbi:hypothetical protein ABPG74_001028 [Tetrahymena malaccensis]